MSSDDRDEYEDKTVIAQMDHVLSEAAPKGEVSTASVVQYSGTDVGKRYPLDRSLVTLGRSSDAYISIAESSVSRIHAKMHCQDHGIELEDVGSANGTYINDQKLEQGRRLLRDGDVVRLGTVMLKFFSADNMDGFVQDKIYRMATIDVGTQIFNKQYLLAALAREFKIAQTHGNTRPLSLIYFDLDHFKKVNDTYGHNAGDQILREGAALVKANVRKDDVFARFGGEEFVMILPNTDLKDAVGIAEKMRRAFENQTFMLEQTGQTQVNPHKQTISLGVSQYAHTMSQPKDFLESADKKLYISKQSGRNRTTS